MNKIERTIHSLHEYERKVLSELKESLTVSELSERTGLKKVEVMRGVQWLKNKKIIIIKKEKYKDIILTRMGRKTLKKGLPEIRFLKVLKKEGITGFKTIKKKAGLNNQEFNKSMGLCRKNDLVKILADKCEITKEGVNYLKKEKEKEKILRKLSEQETITEKYLNKNEKIFKKLDKRGLISIDEKTSRTVSTTKFGLKILKKGIDSDMEYIEQVTPKMIEKESWKNKIFRMYTLSQDVPPNYYGKKQPYRLFIEKMKNKLVSLGFKEMTGPVVETSFYNCDILYMPQDHPARGVHDIFYIKEPQYADLDKKIVKKVKKTHEDGGKTGSTGWRIPFSKKASGRRILRSQTTAVSAHMLMNEELEIPGRYFTIDRNYRPDVIDRTHLPEFNQLEGIVVGEGLNLKSLFGLLRLFAEEIAGVKEYKIVPGYFPFTEPSAEIHIKTEHGWVEMGGSGIFRPEVTKPLGIDVPVIAWGLGFDRMFMSSHNIKDIRKLFSHDINWMRKEKVI